MERDLKRVGTALNSVGKGFSSFGSKLSGIGKRMTAAVSLPLAGLAGYSVKAAADVFESEDLFERAFGGMADSARAWSEEFAASVKRSAYPLRQFASTFMLMLSSMGFTQEKAMDMSQTMTQLAYDMQSAFNIPTMEQAFMELRSGLTGETEPLRKYGVVITETAIKSYAWAKGIAKAGEELTEQQKVIARYGFILDSLRQIQNNAADTSDSASNRMRSLKDRFYDLSIRVGNMLLPVLERLLTFMNGLLDKWDALSPAMKQWAIVAAGAAIAAGPLLMILGSLVSMVGGIVSMSGGVVGALSSIAGAIAQLGLEGTIALAVIASLGLQIAAIWKGWKSGGIRGAAEELGKLQWGAALEGFQKGGIGGAIKAWFGNAFKVGKEGFGDLTSGLRNQFQNTFNNVKAWALNWWNKAKGMFTLGGETNPAPKQPTTPGMAPITPFDKDAGKLEAKLQKEALDAYIDQMDERYKATEDWTEKAGRLIEKFYSDQKQYDEAVIQRQRQAIGFTGVAELYQKMAVAGQRERFAGPDKDLASLQGRKESINILKRLLPEAMETTKILRAQLEIAKKYKGIVYG